MACRNRRRPVSNTAFVSMSAGVNNGSNEETLLKLFFGVDSKVPANRVLQNNLTEFEWVKRNKAYPVFWVRNITNKDCLTPEEIEFLHDKGCKIGIVYDPDECRETEEQGIYDAQVAVDRAKELKIPKGTAVFLEVADDELVTTAYMKGYAEELHIAGYTPGFKANTDATYDFDREYSRGVQTNPEVFKACSVWATSPSLAEYDQITTTHLIHPDNWMPYAPSGMKRREIAIWQYGKNCHPIEDKDENETSFNINLIRNEKVAIEQMF